MAICSRCVPVYLDFIGDVGSLYTKDVFTLLSTRYSCVSLHCIGSGVTTIDFYSSEYRVSSLRVNLMREGILHAVLSACRLGLWETQLLLVCLSSVRVLLLDTATCENNRAQKLLNMDM